MNVNEFFDWDKYLFNLITWIVTPNAAMGKDGFIGLKAAEMSETVKNIQSLVPSKQPGFNQILLSITLLAKTRSQVVVNNLKQLGYDLLNTKTMFIQDKWAEWTERLKSIIPSNIKKRSLWHMFLTTSIGKMRLSTGLKLIIQTRFLVQKYDLAENITKCVS